jgi:hypothetical protein
MPLLHSALPLDDMEAARAFLRDHGKHVACYRLDPREEGKLMVGMSNDGEAKTIAREELNMEVPEGLFGPTPVAMNISHDSSSPRLDEAGRNLPVSRPDKAESRCYRRR